MKNQMLTSNIKTSYVMDFIKFWGGSDEGVKLTPEQLVAKAMETVELAFDKMESAGYLKFTDIP